MRRPQVELREALTEGLLDLSEGLVGDNWKTRRQLAHGRWIGAPGYAAECDESASDRPAGAGEGALAAGRGPAVYRPGFERREPAAGPRLALGSAVIEITRQAAYGMRQVHEPLWGWMHLEVVRDPERRGRRC